MYVKPEHSQPWLFPCWTCSILQSFPYPDICAPNHPTSQGPNGGIIHCWTHTSGGWLCRSLQDLLLCAQAGWNRFVRTRVGMPHIPLAWDFGRCSFHGCDRTAIAWALIYPHFHIFSSCQSWRLATPGATKVILRQGTWFANNWSQIQTPTPNQGVCMGQKPEDRKWLRFSWAHSRSMPHLADNDGQHTGAGDW